MIFLSDVLFILLITFYLAFLLAKKISNRRLIFLVLFATIFLHELAHKAVASYFGYVSYIKAEASFYFLLLTTFLYIFLGLLVPPPIYTAIFAKKVDDGLIYYLAPTIIKENAYQMAMISISGPLVNLVLAGISYLILRKKLYDTEFEKNLFKEMLNFNFLIFLINALPIIPENDGSIFLQAISILIKN